MNSTELGMFFGAAIAVLAPAAIGYAVTKTMNRDREYEDSVKWPFVAGLALSFLMLLGQCSGPSAQARVAMGVGAQEVQTPGYQQ